MQRFVGLLNETSSENRKNERCNTAYDTLSSYNQRVDFGFDFSIMLSEVELKNLISQHN